MILGRHLRCQLRHVTGHRQGHRGRRGGRGDRRPVDRRAGHAAHDADVPHRRHRRHRHRRGLPRVVELFEARSPKGKATLARTSGVVRVGEDEGKGRVITIVGDDGTEDAYTVPGGSRLEVTDGDEVEAGDPIVEGPRDPEGAVGDPRCPRNPAVPRRAGPEGVRDRACRSTTSTSSSSCGR